MALAGQVPEPALTQGQPRLLGLQEILQQLAGFRTVAQILSSRFEPAAGELCSVIVPMQVRL